jgi:hypothetical protein
MKSFKLLISLALLISFTSCTLQKRLYRNGYTVHWNSKNKSTAEEGLNNEIGSSISELKGVNSDLALTTNEIVLEEKSVVLLNEEKSILKRVHIEKTTDLPKCDVMLLRNGEEISVKVIEITPKDVKFKRCDNLEGPTKMINKYYISSITYSDGTKDVFKAEESSKPIISETNSKSDSTKSGFSIASLVFGILSNILFVDVLAAIYNVVSLNVSELLFKIFAPFTIFGGILAIILGASQLSKIRREPSIYKREGLARAGLILGIIGVLLFLLLVSILILLF